MEHWTVIGFIGQLLSYNPLYYIFPGADALAYVTAAVCLIGAIVVFLRRHIELGIILFILAFVTVRIASSLTERNPATVDPSWLWALTVLLLGCTCYVASIATGSKVHVWLQVTTALLAASLYATFASEGMVIRHTSTPDAGFWLDTNHYLWGVDLFLLVAIAILGACEYFAARRNSKEDPGASTDADKQPE